MSGTKTLDEDSGLLTEEELDAVAGGVGPQGQNMRNMSSGVNPRARADSRGIVIDNNEMIIEDNMPTP